MSPLFLKNKIKNTPLHIICNFLRFPKLLAHKSSNTVFIKQHHLKEMYKRALTMDVKVKTCLMRFDATSKTNFNKGVDLLFANG